MSQAEGTHRVTARASGVLSLSLSLGSVATAQTRHVHPSIAPTTSQSILQGDYGHGGCALAVADDGDGIDIYFGLIVRHAVAVTYPSQPLQNSEVMTGRVVKLRFAYSNSSLTQLWMQDLQPSAADRGGCGVVGIHVDEIFSNAPNAEEKEVVVTTLAGDVYVFSESGATRYRTSVPGAAGFYNSILALDLNGDGRKELYVAGSMGLHRFLSPLEAGGNP